MQLDCLSSSRRVLEIRSLNRSSFHARPDAKMRPTYVVSELGGKSSGLSPPQAEALKLVRSEGPKDLMFQSLRKGAPAQRRQRPAPPPPPPAIKLGLDP